MFSSWSLRTKLRAACTAGARHPEVVARFCVKQKEWRHDASMEDWTKLQELEHYFIKQYMGWTWNRAERSNTRLTNPYTTVHDWGNGFFAIHRLGGGS
jgi:hypothetical protein